MKKTTFLSIALIILALSLPLPFLYMQKPSIVGYFNMVILFAIGTQGLNLLLGYAGQVSLGHAAFMAIGGYISAILVMSYNVNSLFAIVIATAFAGLCGLLVGFPSLRLSGFYLAIATMALGSATTDLIKRLSITGGDHGLRSISPLKILNFEFYSEFSKYYLFLFMMVTIFLLVKNLINSRSGRALRAIRDAELTAESVGINVAYYKLVAFVLSSMIAGLSGALYAHSVSYLHPNTFGLGFSIEFLAMAIVGGLGTIWGPLLGASFWVLLPRIIGPRLEYLSTVVFGIAVILSVMFLPYGLSEIIYRLEKKMKLR